MTKSLAALVGTKFRGQEMVDLLASLPQGEPLTLVRDPANIYDRKAVQVWARGHHIGFVKGNQNRDLAARMDMRLAMDTAATFGGKLAIDGGKQPMVEIDG